MHTKTVKEFIDYYKDLFKNEWRIIDLDDKERYELVKEKQYFIDLQDKYKSNVKNYLQGKQVISWLDSLTIMKRIMDNLMSYGLDEINVISEFIIPYSKDKRPDYLICFKNTILIIEMSYLKNKSYAHNNYNDKLTQLLHYESLIKNLVDQKIKTITYVIDYLPEYTFDIKTNLENNQSKNSEHIIKVCDLINRLFKIDTTAIEEIEKIEV